MRGIFNLDPPLLTLEYFWLHRRSVRLSGRPYGADDFLPMLTYVLAQCDMPQLDNEIQYMMELLDPSLLNGEGVVDQRASIIHRTRCRIPLK